MTLLSCSEPLAARYDVALFDLDGVVYVGQKPVPHAVETIDEISARFGMRAAYVTNNASRTPAEVAHHLREFGLDVQDADVVTSAQAAARVLAERLPQGSKVLLLGARGLREALLERDLTPVETLEQDPVAVVQGYNPDMTWRDLAEAAFAINKGILWVASNTDRTIPTPRGIAPGNGSLVMALRHATGAVPLVAGKPEPPLMNESIERTMANCPIVVGDRLDTDIEGAVRAGIPGLLVFTGVTGVADALAANANERPSYLGVDLRSMLASHPEVTVTGPGAASCAGAVVDARGGVLHPAPDDALNVVRAACVAAWDAADRGLSFDLSWLAGQVEIAAAATRIL